MTAAIVLLPGWIAAAIDVRTRRVPNWAVAVGLVAALTAAVLAGSLAMALLGGIVSLLVGMAIAGVARGAFGGGDVKLMAYGGAVVGAAAVPSFLFWMSVAGGLLALLALTVRRRRGIGIPYAPAIAFGCSVVHLLSL